MKIIQLPSPNYNARAFSKPDMIIIHYTGMQSAEAALDRMRSTDAPRVSAHYFIDQDGKNYQLVEEKYRAWHAGISYWQGETDINSRAIGIELDNKGHEHGYHPFPTAQIKSLIILLSDIRTRHTIMNKNIVGHSDIAPMRKQDPGHLFPWDLLAEHGHGLAPETLHEILYSSNKEEMLHKLAAFGYECDLKDLTNPINQKIIDCFMDKISQ